MQELNINYYKLLTALSTALDFYGAGIMRHHLRVAVIAQGIARELGMGEEEINSIVYASMVHDVGTSTFKEKSKLISFEIEKPFDHCFLGSCLLSLSPLLKPYKQIILCHHDRWDGQNTSGLRGDGIPLASRVIHIADRIDVLIHNKSYILHQQDAIIEKISDLSGTVFDPGIVDVFKKLAEKESFWLDLTSTQIEQILLKRLKVHLEEVNLEDLLSISEVFARVIDGKSKFTHVHSRFVSKVAGDMAVLAGYSTERVQMIKVAGLLHDLGKLAVPETIIEKPGRLTDEEYKYIKSHTYYTYQTLDMIEGFEEIKEWAAYHHECINGSGYPFKLSGFRLSPESRMLAVSDIFAALVEDRPYRLGLPRSKVETILLEKVGSKDLDIKWVELLLDNYNELVRHKEDLENQ